MKSIHILFLIFSLAYCNAQDLKFIKANNSSVYSQGRIAFNKDGSGDFSYSGVSFKITTNSSIIHAVFEDLSGPSNSNYFNVIIDDKITKTLKVGDKKKKYVLAENLSPNTTHVIEIFKRTEANVGSSRFHGFEISSNADLIPTEKPKKKLLLIGDSFSCGYGNLAEIPAPPEGNPSVGFSPQNEDNYFAWGAISSRTMNYQYHCIAYSGRGMYRNNTGTKNGTLPKIFDRIEPDNEQSIKWKHKDYNPDIIVIKLGTNDFMYEAFQNIPVDSTEYVETYIKFIKRLNKLHPEAKIICVAGGLMSDEWPEGKFALSRIKSMIKQVVISTNDIFKSEKSFYLELPTHHSIYGEDWHPTVSWHEKYAELLNNKIKEME